ncbi:MAG: molybdate ABC transporter substrate-binding protein [Geitlerinemataceae cyanobacterium]
MSIGKRLFFLGCLFLCLVLTFGCDRINNLESYNPPSATELTLSAAASLKESLEAIKPLYTKKNPDITLIYNFGSSGSLQQQIEQGAPVDILFSAATKQMNALEKKGLLLEGTRQDFLKNEMVLIVPKNGTIITGFKDLINDFVEKIALGEPKSVPAGTYAEEVLNSLKIADVVKSKAVYGKDVKQVLNYVATGNVDAGIVYKTDARNSEAVKIVEIAPENTHSPVVYPIAILKSSKYPEAAKRSIEFLAGETAKQIFEEYGFKS